MNGKTDFEYLKESFDELGIVYTIQTNENNSDVNPRHIALFLDDFLFVFDKKTGIFFDTRNLSNE